MKTSTCLLFLILTQGLFTQMPSINEHNLLKNTSFSSMKNQEDWKKIDSLKIIVEFLNETIKKDESSFILNSDDSTINFVKDLEEKIAHLEKRMSPKELIYLQRLEFYSKKNEGIQKEIAELTSNYKVNDSFLKTSRKIKEKENRLLKNLIKLKNDSLQLEKGYDALFPSWRIYSRNDFFITHYGNELTKTSFVNTIGLNFDDSGSTMQSELITDNLGPLRIAFGSVVSTTKMEESNEEAMEASNEEDAYKRLINGGGNFYLETLLPFLTYSHSNLTVYSFFNLKGAMDIKSFGNNIDTSTGNATLGNTTYFGINSDNKKFNFFIQGNLHYSFGSETFYSNLGLDQNKAFLNGKLLFGLTLDQKIRFTAITNTFGSDAKIRNGKLMFGVQFLPDLSK